MASWTLTIEWIDSNARVVTASSANIEVDKADRLSVVDILENVAGSLCVMSEMGDDLLQTEEEEWMSRRTMIMLRGKKFSRSLSIEHKRDASEDELEASAQHTARWLRDAKTTEILR